jgi:hypothetical protein
LHAVITIAVSSLKLFTSIASRSRPRQFINKLVIVTLAVINHVCLSRHRRAQHFEQSRAFFTLPEDVAPDPADRE